MKKTASTHWWILAAVCCCMLLSVAPSSAAESDASKATPKIDNVGFMKSPPQELVDRFPMCDAFLKVEWIDEEKRVGYGQMDLYNSEGRVKAKRINTIVYYNGVYSKFDFSADLYKVGYGRTGEFVQVLNQKGKDKFFEILKKGAFFPELNSLIIKYKEHSYELVGLYTLFQDILKTPEPYTYTLASGMINVCIPCPRNQVMWLAETRNVRKIYNAPEANEIIKRVEETIGHGNESFMELASLSVMDINHDGREDYITSSGRVVYSKGDKYLSATPAENVKKNNSGMFSWKLLDHHVCKVDAVSSPVLITDGYNYYYNRINDDCNLTALTQGGYGYGHD